VIDVNITSWKVLDVVCPVSALPGAVSANRTAALWPSAAADDAPSE
jgi:hypothetical protein